MNKSYLFKLILITILSLILTFRDIIYFKYYSIFKAYDEKFFDAKLRVFDQNDIKFKSICDCRKSIIELNKKDDNYIISEYLFNENLISYNKLYKYNISINEFEKSIFTCNMYNSLRRGPKQKIISYSLYGKNKFYYRYLQELINIIKIKYPEWIVKIYHDSSIDKSIICELECAKTNNNDTYLDIVDFCDIESIPFDLISTWNASYMHGMTWRWLPQGDSFIDYYASRDSDAYISQREIDSVNVWLNSNTIFHIMRGINSLFMSNF